MLTASEQERRAVLLASLENALEFREQVLGLRELLELERKDATSGPEYRFDCLRCGDDVTIDEDGCCAQCGQSTIFIRDGKPEHGGLSGCNICGADDSKRNGVRAVGKYRACLGCEPDATTDPAKEYPEWRKELARLHNLFFGNDEPLEDFAGFDDSGAPIERDLCGGTFVLEWGRVREHESILRALWPLEQLRRDVVAKSQTITLLEEVAVLMPGAYTIPHGAYKFSPADSIWFCWRYQGERGSVTTRESTERILAAIDKRGAEILANGVQSC